MRLRPAPLVLAFALTSLATSLACTDPDAPTVEPFDGNWNYFEMGVDNNTCPVFVGVVQPSTTLQIDYDGGDTFEIEQGDQMDIACSITRDDFVCADRLVSTTNVPELNLDLELRVRIEGTFDSDTEAHGEQQVSVVCLGDGCGALDDIPCSYQLPFTAEAQ